MHVGRDSIFLDRFQCWQAHRADAFLAALAEYAHRLCVRIDLGHIERSQFAQAQAAAVYAATKGSKEPVYVSPFVGRLDDQGEDGMDLVRNIKKMYEPSDGHVHVLAASIRTINHLLCSFFLDAELATVPSKVLEEWAAAGFPMPDHNFSTNT